MRAVIGLMIVGTVILLGEGTVLYKRKRKKELIVFTVSLLLGLVLYTIVLLRLPVPTVAELIDGWLAPVVKPIAVWLERGRE